MTSAVMATYARAPIAFVRGEGCRLFDRDAFDRFLSRFETVFRRVVSTEGKAPLSGAGETFYFIGRKPA